jgi:hypothetical protein
LGRSRSSIDRRAVGPARGNGFLTDRKTEVQSLLRGRHLTEPGADSAPARSYFSTRRKGGCHRFGVGGGGKGEDNSGFEQKFAHLLPDKIAHPGGGDIACEQLDGMRPQPFSLLVGALTAGPTAEGWRPSAGTDLEPFFADRAARSFSPPPFWSSGCHPRSPFDRYRHTLRQ